MKCLIVLVLAFVAFSNAQLQGTEGGDNLLATAAAAGSSGQMGSMMGGDQSGMNLADMLSRAGSQMGGGMFRGMTGNTGQWGNMRNLMRMFGRGRRGMNNMMGQGWGMGMGFNQGMGQMFGMGRGMDRDWNMGQGSGFGNMMGQGSGLGNLLRYAMLSRGKYVFFFLNRVLRTF